MIVKITTLLLHVFGSRKLPNAQTYANNAPKIVLDKVVSVRFDTNVNNLPRFYDGSSD